MEMYLQNIHLLKRHKGLLVILIAISGIVVTVEKIPPMVISGDINKYILRQGHKTEKGMSDTDKAIEDLQKAVFYIEDKISMLKK